MTRLSRGWQRNYQLIVALLVVMFMLGACAGEQPAPATEEPTAEPTSEEAAAPSEAEPAEEEAAAETSEEGPIKVGILHSLSGTMAISEVSVKDATLLAIEQINAAGGVMGRMLEPVIEDGASDWPTFAEKATKLLLEDEVAVVFGCWTSASRKAVLPVFEQNNGLLFYPVQYEGLEMSPNIFYTGAEPTQQIIPGVEYLLDQGHSNIYLLGSDYVFPRTANTIIKAQLESVGATLAGEEYIPLGGTEFSTIISKIQAAEPDAIFNTLNGDSNVAFFKQFKDAGFTPEDIPVMSVSVAEEEVRGIGPENIAGHLVAWNYFQTTDTPENEAFVEAYKAAYGEDRVTADPIEAGYFGVYLWKELVEAAGSTDVDAVREAAKTNEITFAAPEGEVKVDGNTQHTWKTVRIGQIMEDGLIEEVYSSETSVEPDPFLQGYDWAADLAAAMGAGEAIQQEEAEEPAAEMAEEAMEEEVAAEASDEEPIKVGILHSLSGTMAISEVSVKDATLLAIEQINAAGGIMGRMIEPVIEDGASDWPTFAEKATKLLLEDEVAVVFGCWTSASRKAVLPVFEQNNGLLFYPVQYEGLEMSPNIFYTGAEPTQQIIPGVEYLLDQGHSNIYLLGSDYVFPRTANTIIKLQLANAGATVAGEEYIPLGGTEFSTIISKIQAAEPDAIFNTLNGDSNVAFFKQFKDAGFTPEDIPVMSVSVAEEEVRGIGPENIAGHLVAWNYFQTTDTPENEAFVEAYKAAYGEDRVTADPIEAGYFGVYLWKELVEAAESTDVDAVREAAKTSDISFAAPEGMVRVDGDTQHTWKTVRIGQIGEDGLIEEVYSSEAPVEPDPFLEGYEWAADLAAAMGAK